MKQAQDILETIMNHLPRVIAAPRLEPIVRRNPRPGRSPSTAAYARPRDRPEAAVTYDNSLYVRFRYYNR